MICPNCQNTCGETDRFCFRCGTPLSKQKPAKKGSHAAPLLILIALSVLGIALFFIMPMGSSESDTPWFTIEDGYLYFDESRYIGNGELTVPSVVNGETVLHIGDHCFEASLGLTAVILPDTVQTIGDAAFSNCVSLRGIYIPEGVTDIGSEAFLYCTSLEAVSIPSTAKIIGEDAFGGCSKLSYIFYNGIHSHWEDLYSTYISPSTQVFCTDGTFLQR